MPLTDEIYKSQKLLFDRRQKLIRDLNRIQDDFDASDPLVSSATNPIEVNRRTRTRVGTTDSSRSGLRRFNTWPNRRCSGFRSGGSPWLDCGGCSARCSGRQNPSRVPLPRSSQDELRTGTRKRTSATVETPKRHSSPCCRGGGKATSTTRTNKPPLTNGRLSSERRLRRIGYLVWVRRNGWRPGRASTSIRDHATKMENMLLGLPRRLKIDETKIKTFCRWL